MTKPSSSGFSGVPRVSVKRRVALIILLTLVAGSLSYPAPANWLIDQTNNALRTHFGHIDKPFVLGLDLQGGTRLEYEADVSKVVSDKQSTALDGVRDVIERRVNAMGVSEPLVQTTRAGSSWRVSVELAGVKDINQAIKMIGETPILEFKEQNTEAGRSLTADERKKIDDSVKQAKEKSEDFLSKAVKDPAKFGDLVRQSPDDLVAKDQGGDLGFIKDKPEYQSIYEAANTVNAGGVVGKVVEMAQADAVVKVEEKKDAGNEVKARHILIQWVGASQAPTSTTRTKEQALAEALNIKKELTDKNFVDLAKKYSEEPGAAQSGGDLGWFGKGVMVQQFEDKIFTMKKGEISDPVETAFGYHLIFLEDERAVQDIRVSVAMFKKVQESDILPPPDAWKNTELTGKQLAHAVLEFDQRTGSPEVSLEFDDEGAKLFADITKRNVGKPVAIFLDGQPISVPTVQTEILGGKAVITSPSFSVNEAKLLAQRLQAGALPVPIKLIAQQSVGPMLGADSVQASLKAALWGLLLVSIFMLLFYRLPGLISVIALGVYALLSVAVFKLLPVTLSLSGIAGFILSIGMAVDANVLIFERLKEELKLGKPYSQAMEEAFKRAWLSIRDGNVTSLISCAVLYWFTSSVIKGFALTLAIGVLLSMFTAITITRNLMRWICTPANVSRFGWLVFVSKPKEGDKK
ncbi:MAG: protein translocase subunit SecD [Patescibacteria group bacterium]|nr:protein translocase subunit SecD [Patescibacteria group bacterium]